MASNIVTVNTVEQSPILGAVSPEGKNLVALNQTYLNSLKNTYGVKKYITTTDFDTLLDEAVILTSIYVTNGVYSRTDEIVGHNYTIPQWKFSQNSDLVGVIIPEDIKFGTNSWAFSDSPNLSYINLEGVTSLSGGGKTFGDSGLAIPINMPRLTGTVGNSSTFARTKIPEVKSLGAITNICSEMFIGCTNLKTVNLPTTVTTIGYRSFENCSSLTTINIPSGVTRIEGRAFWYDTLLNTTIPTSVTRIDAGAFAGCSSLAITVNLPNLTLLDGQQAFDSSGIVSISSLGNITNIPGGSTIVGAFSRCKSLTAVTLPSTLTTIEAGAFGEDDAIVSMNLPTSLTSIGNAAFKNCISWNISELYLPNLTSLGGFAFSGPNITKITNLGTITRLEDGGQNGGVFARFNSSWVGNLTEVRLPATMTYIGAYAFYRHINLVSFYCYATTPPSLSSAAFNSTNSTFKIYVPSASVNSYKSATNWSSFASRIYSI